ncbi:helix-turn-helix domain-containing protein [Halorubrum sp. CBA1229]|jgi:predicted DNA binding protein|uniref:helix-turn-helix domain-containing protein n=1 Tax=Halorubrum sp. CBA1229 TaxID=1853699 RepID=UPI000F3ECB05|nr:helix-turn-helix domain-containing protein [Halorubrum sp. CBA1229]QKY17574.1 helix-turn-helix domain-containing protein [Halorubrum sp. CBA1229]
MVELEGEGGERQLRVDLEVDPADEWDCPMVTQAESASEVTVNAVGDECTVEVHPAGGEGIRRDRGEVSEDCLCRVFQEFGHVPHVRRVDEGTVLVTSYVDDRAAVREVVAALRSVLDRVRLVRLAVVTGPESTEQATVDLSALTPKQREGMELAVVRGYFDDDGDVSLGELADELDISKSALSQRLRAAQAKLVTDVFEGVAE